MAQLITRLPTLYESYKRWVSANPQVVGDIEQAIKWISYFLVGRVNNSANISELIYALSNLLVLFNDRIIEQSRRQYSNNDQSKYKLQLLLTALEYSEVFIELSASKLWGESGRWFFITVVQIVKFIGRYLLKTRYRQCVGQCPPITALDRKNTDEFLAETSAAENVADTFGSNNSLTFTLKRSGKVIRKVEGSPPITLRTWKTLPEESNFDAPQNAYSMDRISFAELLYISKPLLHLGSMGLFGTNSWKSYCCALFMDIYSLRLYHKNRNLLNKKQRLEISRRTVAMLLYLMRTPFYDKFSKRKLNLLLDAVACTIPFSKAICDPIKKYVPYWQGTYFYMWST